MIRATITHGSDDDIRSTALGESKTATTRLTPWVCLTDANRFTNLVSSPKRY